VVLVVVGGDTGASTVVSQAEMKNAERSRSMYLIMVVVGYAMQTKCTLYDLMQLPGRA